MSSKFKSSAVIALQNEIESLQSQLTEKQDALYSAQVKEASAWVKANCYPSRNIKETIFAMLKNFGRMERKQMAHILVESGKYSINTAYINTTKGKLPQYEIYVASIN